MQCAVAMGLNTIVDFPVSGLQLCYEWRTYRSRSWTVLCSAIMCWLVASANEFSVKFENYCALLRICASYITVQDIGSLAQVY